MQDSFPDTYASSEELREDVQKEKVAIVLEAIRSLLSGESAAAKSTTGSLSALSERLYRMILYSVGRVDYYENLRHRHLTLGLGLFAGSFAFSSVLLALRQHLTIHPLAFLFLGGAALSLLATGARMLYLYNKKTTPEYAYRPIADIRSWYYRYNFPNNLETSEESTMPVKLAEARAAGEGLMTFINRWMEFAQREDGFLAEDLEQVFILQMLQNAKVQIVRTMANVLTTGAYTSMVLFAVGLLLLLGEVAGSLM